ncbi:MAG: ribonuclease [Xanthomonadaceae bacterium]|nr:ribonuclease [Xanthomonadaceae bacterium]
MRRKVFIAVAAVAVIGLFLWSQQPQRAPTHERSSTTATSDAATSDGAERGAPDALETPPPIALPPETGEDAANDTDARKTARAPSSAAYPRFLPPEAVATLRTIERGGPYPFRQDDSVFQNRERKLPPQPRGYYREYTVKTPGSRDRGARRIVAGGRPPAEFFYTDDHYRSFRRFTLDGRERER